MGSYLDFSGILCVSLDMLLLCLKILTCICKELEASGKHIFAPVLMCMQTHAYIHTHARTPSAAYNHRLHIRYVAETHLSPSDLVHWTILPSFMVEDKAGMLTSMDMRTDCTRLFESSVPAKSRGCSGRMPMHLAAANLSLFDCTNAGFGS
jgi:hypothetical protein